MLTVLVVVVLVVIAVLVIAMLRPDRFRVERSATIDAPAERIFPLINDFQQWRSWSPYENRDPAMKRSYAGPGSGLGAIYGWEGNKNIGSGRMEISASEPSSRIAIKLDFFAPFKANNTAEFLLQPVDGSTRVTWAMEGRANIMSKLMGLFINMDKMIGRDFEEGLQKLRALSKT
ncbi:SRPBCC family protein [Dyella sp. 20L07]|uniref:SRPBCC family protein n=1 Tax=Dyella sp. 20L07 TaxID=3384240 RepID=UPI003D266250